MSPPRRRKLQKGKKVRVLFRRNRGKPARKTNWTSEARQADNLEFDTQKSESVVAKGALSRQRTIIVPDEGDAAAAAGARRGIVIAMRGLYADVDDGKRVWACTVRRVLRTRLIEERHPVTVGDHVHFSVEWTGDAQTQEGVVESVDPRKGKLCRKVGRRIHTMVANVDFAIIVSSAAEPAPKPHLIDRYIVASLAGGITPVICMNKIDLDKESQAEAVLPRYAQLGYITLLTSVVTGQGVAALRDVLKDKASVIVGQSGVGKSSLLNVVQPGLELKVGDIMEHIGKGRHTTSTASLIRLKVGGYVVDTPGIRTLDLSTVPRNEFEMFFTEFIRHVEGCKFSDCTHTHEDACTVKRAVDTGQIHPDRYESYVRLFEELG